MIRLPIVSVLQDGIIEDFDFRSEDFISEHPGIVLENVTFDERLFGQLSMAKSIAQDFLSQPYVRPLVENSLKDAKLLVCSPKGGVYEGTSFGLPFLIGWLALGLGVPVRQGQLFSAALHGTCNTPQGTAAGVQLGAVDRVGAKLSAACIEHRSCLFLRPENEDQMLKFEQSFWRGQADRSCRPYTLPDRLSIASVIAMSLDHAKLLARAISSKSGEAFLLLMYLTAGEMPHGASLVKGIGPVLAKLRGEDRLSNVMYVTELTRYLGIKNVNRAEELLLLSSRRCLEKCVSDPQRADIIKGLISEDPNLRLFAMDEQGRSKDGGAGEADLDIWLNRIRCHSFSQLQIILTTLRTCSHLADDFEGYWPRIERLVVHVLSTLFEHILGQFQTGDLNFVGQQLYAFINSEVIDCIGRLRSSLVRRVASIISPCLEQLRKTNNKQIVQMVEFAERQLRIYQLPEALIELEQQEKPILELTFSLTDGRGGIRHSAPGTVLPRPPLSRINDLQLLISGPQRLSLLVPSPVLLFENCCNQHDSFCKRRDFRLVDDTMSHFPENDAATVRDLFNGNHCNIISFQIRRSSTHSRASIRWRSNLNPWPPAIDSQFLSACIAQIENDFQPHRLLDIGCGSGYLSIVAAHRWPSLEQLHLVDIDILSIAAAKVNIEQDSICKALFIQTYWRGFDKFEGNGFDILLCAPPYLPDRPWPVSRIEVATNGTELLEQVVRRAGNIGKETWMVFSILAWPEFQRALAQVPNAYKTVEVLRRDFAPFRITWLEPRPPKNNSSENDYLTHRQYYENVLMKRGLIDFDEMSNWPKYLQDFPLSIPDNCSACLNALPNESEIEEKLDIIQKDSRGYRFWHEIRVVRLVSAT